MPVVALALALAGFCASRLEVIVFPDSDEPYFTVTISADEDRSTAFMQKLTDDIEAIVNAEAAVTGCSSIVGATLPAGAHRRSLVPGRAKCRHCVLRRRLS